MREIDNVLYGKYWMAAHLVLSVVSAGAVIGVLWICDIPLCKLLSIINNDTTMLSASIGGFLFAGMSILISVNDNKKLAILKELGKENIIFRILICSILCFMISMVLMVIDIKLFSFDSNVIEIIPKTIKGVSETLSLFILWVGLVYLFSSLKIFYFLFK